MLPTAIVAYLALFATVGFLFVLASLILGWFLRAQSPSREKAATYECGEPSIGPSNVQFDLRFYVVALVFLIFEVEVAFFFPPAVVFGKANLLRNPDCSDQYIEKTYREFGIGRTLMDEHGVVTNVEKQANTLLLASMLDLSVFFAVLLVGFAFVWSRGDLNWVRSTRHPTTTLETAVIMSNIRKGDLG